MKYAVILAGGIGSRFWPLSRESEPKQFLNICSKRPMIEEALRRVTRLVNSRNIYLATNSAHYPRIRKYLKKFKVPASNILLEPYSKNTFAPIAFLSKKIIAGDKEAVCAVLPCDHYVRDCSRFLSVIKQAMEVAATGYIVTLGIRPSRPETGYGYIKIKPKALPAKQSVSRRVKAYGVDRFVEKPVLAKAKKFLKDRKYFWNSGIFVFKAQKMLDEVKRLQLKAYRDLCDCAEIREAWSKMPSISIDYAVMEKARSAALIPLDCGWSDLGSWQAVEEVSKKDRHGNVLRGNCLNIGCKNSTLWSGGRLIAALGLNNIIVAEAGQALLVCSKDKAQDVKKIVGMLKGKRYK
ncbi:MAG: mannose-1-phosphate guanylyltransferase [Candidatus Omnitrophica bacterium]|nr:mannose-1-phosphate guanylyltransferase [Candidatus Omnitrophota bacterium]